LPIDEPPRHDDARRARHQTRDGYYRCNGLHSDEVRNNGEQHQAATTAGENADCPTHQTGDEQQSGGFETRHLAIPSFASTHTILGSSGRYMDRGKRRSIN